MIGIYDPTAEVAYRYVDIHYAPIPDAYGDCYGRGSVEIVAQAYPVLRHTKCGFWILEWNMGRERFVNAQRTKMFAHLNKDDALESFIERKKTQIQILENQKARASDALKLARTLRDKNAEGI
jgi:hypothetical protein